MLWNSMSSAIWILNTDTCHFDLISYSYSERPSHVKHFQMLINTQFTLKMLSVSGKFIFYSHSMNAKSNFRRTKGLHLFLTNISISLHNPVPKIYDINTYFDRIHAWFDYNYYYYCFISTSLSSFISCYFKTMFHFHSINLVYFFLQTFYLEVERKFDNFNFNFGAAVCDALPISFALDMILDGKGNEMKGHKKVHSKWNVERTPNSKYRFSMVSFIFLWKDNNFSCFFLLTVCFVLFCLRMEYFTSLWSDLKRLESESQILL